MEGLYVGEKGAPIVAIGIPKDLPALSVSNNNQAWAFKIEIPHMLSILGKHSFNGYVPGLKDLIQGNPQYGIWPLSKLAKIGAEAKADLIAYHKAKAEGNTAAMQAAKKDFYSVVWSGPDGLTLRKCDLIGYGYFKNVSNPDLIHPPVAPVFYAFHIMVALGFWFIILFIWAWFSVVKGSFANSSLLKKLAVLSVPLPWIATSFGWMSAEIGRQPWTVFGILPTAESVTPIALSNVQATFFMFLVAFVILGIGKK